MAEAMLVGVKELGFDQAKLIECDKVMAQDFIDADAIIIGTPVKMGGIDHKLKAMIDTVMASLWIEDEIVGKVAGCFATGGGFGKAGAGVEVTMISLANVLLEMGLVYVPLPKNTVGFDKGGLQWGAYALSANENMCPKEISVDSLNVAKTHAQNIVRVASCVSQYRPFMNNRIA